MYYESNKNPLKCVYFVRARRYGRMVGYGGRQAKTAHGIEANEWFVACFIVQWQRQHKYTCAWQAHSKRVRVYRLPTDANDMNREQITCLPSHTHTHTHARANTT